MQILYRVGAFFCTVAVIFILLITSIEAVLYWNKDYFAKEYEKYEIAASIGMNTQDLLTVTNEMMLYLKDGRDNLNIETTVEGKSREFFNEKEKAHMVDVKALFLAGIMLRRICIAVVGLCILMLAKEKQMNKLWRFFRIGVILFICVGIGLTAVISINFFEAFQVFHKIFFRNQLWILDPNTDLLINIVPQPFFVDTAIRIGGLFALSLVVLWCISTYLLKDSKKTGV